MITTCNLCKATYDDEFRLTICPHNLFPANDGQNNFRLHTESVITYPEDDFPPHNPDFPDVNRRTGNERETTE